MLVIPNSVELILLNIIASAFNGFAMVELYVNDWDPGPDDVIDDYDFATFDGYAAVALNFPDPAAGDGFGRAIVYADDCDFTNSGPAAETVYGYLVRATTGELRWAERFLEGGSVTIPSGLILRVVPTFTFRTEPPA